MIHCVQEQCILYHSTVTSPNANPFFKILLLANSLVNLQLSLLNISQHLNCVAALPCEIFRVQKLPCLVTECSKLQCKTQPLKKVVENNC